MARAGLGVVGVLVVAWLAVMAHNAHLEARAAAATRHGGTPGQLAHAAADLRRAGLLNPDTTPDVARAVVLRAQGRDRQAAALVADVVRREPDNLLAWRLVGVYAGDRDPAALVRAGAAQRRLDPLSVRPR